MRRADFPHEYRGRPLRPTINHMSQRKIIVHLPEDMSDAEHAELANGIWAIAFGASSIEIEAPSSDAVNQEMDRFWKAAPRLTPKGWTRGEMY